MADLSAPEMPKVPLKMRLAQMWVEERCKLIALLVAVVVSFLLIVFLIIYFLVIEPNQAKSGVAHALEVVPGMHFLQLRQHI